MKLLVRVVEARNLLAMDSNGFSDPYVKLSLGNQRHRSKVVKMSLNPTWDEEFSFDLTDARHDLKIRVYDEDMLGFDDFLGQVKVPIESVLAAEKLSMGTRWYQLHPRNKNDKIVERGEICVTISLQSHESHDLSEETIIGLRSLSDGFVMRESELGRQYSISTQSTGLLSVASGGNETEESKKNYESQDDDHSSGDNERSGNAAGIEIHSDLNEDGIVETEAQASSKALYPIIEDEHLDVQEASTSVQIQNEAIETCSEVPLDELLKAYELAHPGVEPPANLPGGILLDQCYLISPTELNNLLFAPSSSFRQSLMELQGSTDIQIGPWRAEDAGAMVKRVVIFTTAPSKLVKAVKATEEQTYLKAEGKEYAVLHSVSTPDVPCGNCFKTEVLLNIMPGPEQASGERSSRLLVSWRMNFIQSTMIKGMIENGAKQGLKQSYAQFAELLSQRVTPVATTVSRGDQALTSLQAQEESIWKLVYLYLGNFNTLFSLFVALLISVHMLLVDPHIDQGLEFPGLDLPDSISEVVLGGVIVLFMQAAFKKITRFIQAREQKGGDHGIKAKGDGWLLAVALIEGTKIAPVDATGFSDPYVVFTCNGQSKKSSIKFQTLEPQWNEIFEFDAMDDPPAMMYINVYDFDGPFEEVTSLGSAEINLVKSNLSELADIWLPLQGNLAQSRQSKLHLRIFLNNSKGHEVVTEYLTKMGEKVGDKLPRRSPQINVAFQKLFCLPPDEFLVVDFSCYLKRKMLTQGRLFLSPRTIGFYSKMFGHETKFLFLWEDIETIQVVPPSMASMWSSSILIVLHKGKGTDATHGAKLMLDGKPQYYFQSFSSFDIAKRTIMALWKARALSVEDKALIAAEESEIETFEDSKALQMSEVLSSNFSIDIAVIMKLFEGGSAEMRIMEKIGCLNYSVTEWMLVKRDEYQRQVHYKFDKKISPVGGEVTSSQRKIPCPDHKGWIVEEIMELQGVILSNNFIIHIRYKIEEQTKKQKACSVKVSVGVEWLKSSKHQKRLTSKIVSNSSQRLKEMFKEAARIK